MTTPALLDGFFDEVDESAKQLALHLRERVLQMPDPQPVTRRSGVTPFRRASLSRSSTTPMSG